MPTKKRQDRFEQILDALRLTRGAGIRELAQRLGVSEMTVRRDLEALAAEGRVSLAHAGAVASLGAAERGLREYSLADARAAQASAEAAEKMHIGQKAASLVDAGDSIFVDSGATTEWLVRSIPVGTPLTIVCCALNILVEAGKGAGRSLIFAGGTLRADTLVFESPEGVSLLRRLRVNKAFLSAGGASDSLGVTCSDPAEAELKKAAVAMSATRVLVTDSRKFGRVRPAWFADLRDFDAVVTDPGISLEYVEILRNLGITLHVV
jgi:DeoR family deoxyribose operon repressor